MLERNKVLQIELNSTYRKCKKAAHMVLADHPISQLSLDISSIWTSITAVEVSKLQLRMRLVFLVLVPQSENLWFLAMTLVLTVFCF
jgi:hypothetical protein